MLTNLFLLFAASLLVVLNWDVLLRVIKYYLKPGSEELHLRFWNPNEHLVVQVVLLNLGLAIAIGILVPDYGVVSKLQLPATLGQAIEMFAWVAMVEELIFRIIPWGILYLVRRATKRSRSIEIFQVVAAIVLALVFGAMHVGNNVNPDFWTYFRTLAQTTGGITLWYLIEKKGIAAPIVAHFVYDMVVWGIAYIPTVTFN